MPTHFENGVPYIEYDGEIQDYFYGYKPSSMYNYVEIFDERSDPRYNFNMELYTNFDIIEGLKFESRYGYRMRNNYFRNFNTNIGNPQSVASALDVNSGLTIGYTWQNTLTYNKTIKEHRINVVAGTTLAESTFNRVSAKRTNFPESEPDELKYLDFGDATTATNGEDFRNHRTNSYFARVNYSLMDKYLLTATVRRDGDAYFHPDVRWGTFPSVSLGWVISDEDFMSNLEWLDVLKLRAGTGEVGRARDNYAYLNSVSSGELTRIGDGNSDYYFGGARNTGKIVTGVGNPNLTWETTRMTNYGLDFGIGKFSGSVEYFKNTTFDILLPAQIPDIAGYSYGVNVSTAPFVNAGEVNTHGVDFNLNYAKTDGDFHFSINLNGAYSVNELTDLYQQEYIGEEPTNSFLGGVTTMSRSYVGESIGSFYGYRWAGMFNSAAEVDAANQNARDIAQQNNSDISQEDLNNTYYISAQTAPGDFMFKDLNGDGQITDADKEHLGSGNPTFSGGLNFSADYKGFDFSLNFAGVAGNKIHAAIEPVLLNASSFNNSRDILNHWTPENQNTNVPRLTMNDPNFNYRASDRWLYDGAYLRCQNIILGYTLPQKIMGKVVKEVRIYANAKNMFTISNYAFLDPEVQGSTIGAGDVDMGAGVDIGSMPLPRAFTFGINAKF
jgi:TonB-linked SusC/RagA family outer membrane protein